MSADVAVAFRAKLAAATRTLEESHRQEMAALNRLAEELQARILRLTARLDALEGDGGTLGTRTAPPDTSTTGAGSVGRLGAVPIAEVLVSHGLEFIDTRDRHRGVLYVLGEPHMVLPILESLRHRGVEFVQLPEGTRATDGRPAWFTEYRDPA